MEKKIINNSDLAKYSDLIKEDVTSAMLKIEEDIMNLIPQDDKELIYEGKYNFSPEMEQQIMQIFNEVVKTLWEKIEFDKMRPHEIKKIETNAIQINNFGFKHIFSNISRFFSNQLINTLIESIKIPKNIQDILKEKGGVNIENATELAKITLKHYFFVNSTDFMLDNKNINIENCSYEDKVQYLLCIIRRLGTDEKIDKIIFYNIYENLSKEEKFEYIFKQKINNYINITGNDITSCVVGFTKIFEYFVENNKFDNLEKICNSIKDIKFKWVVKDQNLLDYMMTQVVSTALNKGKIESLPVVINIAYKDEETKQNFLLDNFKQGFKDIFGGEENLLDENRKNYIKSYVEVIYNIYPDIEKRNEMINEFHKTLNNIEQKYEYIIDETSKELDKKFYNKLVNDERSSITITNVDDLVFKKVSFVVNEEKIDKEFAGQHSILDVELKTENLESKGKFSLEIPNTKNLKMTDIKIYYYHKENKDKPGIRTEIKFGDVEIENKFKEQIIDAICKGKGLETEGKNCNEKLTMAVGAIQTGKVKEQKVDKPKDTSSNFSSKNWSMSIQNKQQGTNQQTSFSMGSSY